MTYSLLTTLAISVGLASAQSFTYTTVDPPGSNGATVNGLNNLGQMVGGYTDANGVSHGFVRSADGTTYRTFDAPGAVPGSTNITAINNVGQITGTFRNADSNSNRNFVSNSDGTSFTPFDLPDNGPGMSPYGINDAGDISGMDFAVSASIGKGFLRKADGTLTYFQMTGNSFDGGIRTFGLNNAGTIVGYFVSGGSIVPVIHGFVRDASGTITPFDLPGTDRFTELRAINNHGQVLGTLALTDQSFVGLADGSYAVSVPGAQYSNVTAIDDNGRVAGYFSDGKLYHGFLGTPAESSNQPVIRSSPAGVVTALAFGGPAQPAPGVSGPGPIGPGTWIEIYGNHLSSTTRTWAASDFRGSIAPTSLDGVSVTIAGVPAFVSYVSPGQVNALVPSTITAGSVDVVVTNGSLTSAAFTVPVTASQASLLVLPLIAEDERYLGAVFADFATYALPPGYTTAVPSRRARAGDTIVLFGVGLGPVDPDVPVGQIAAQASVLKSQPTVSFDGTPGKVTYAGLVTGTVGLYQINVMVPTITMPSGRTFDDQVHVTMQVNGTMLPVGNPGLVDWFVAISQ
jgi:uncharacterized protein (TIGR03437 family)